MSKNILPAALSLALVAGIAAAPAAFAGPKWLERLKGDKGEEAEQSEDAKATEEAPAEEGKKSRSSRSDSGRTRKVEGLNGYSGEIQGTPIPNSPFNKLQIGMPQKQVSDLVGQGNDSGSYGTAKGYLPFVAYGSDTTRTETVYKGVGRLIFTHSNNGGMYLIKIIHDASEDGYR